MANAVSSNGYDGGGGSAVGRAPRLPRWTRQEILVLIQGKRVVEARGRRRGAAAAAEGAAAVEPKWAAVSAYCRRHGVERGPVQCRKRWSNLAGDYKKIKEWERKKGGAGEGKESFWAMRNDLRRERRLPGFFDREVFDILDGAAEVVAVAAAEEEEEGKGRKVVVVEEEEAVFDSGRTAGDDGLFSDCEEEKELDEEDEPVEEERPTPVTAATAATAEAVVVMPISEKMYEPFQQESAGPGAANEKQPADNPEKGSSSREGQKRQRTSEEGSEDTSMQHQLIEILERNSRMLTAQLESQNINCQLDRDQRKEHANSLLGVLGKLADALGRIADKL